MQSWQELIEHEQSQAYFKNLCLYLEQERAAGQVIYPPSAEIFNAFKLTPLEQVKVVILGQDPYHGPQQAHGLAFSVNPGIAIPPSLKNIYKELANDIAGFTTPRHGDLRSWAKQGVFLLNTVLTVRHAAAHSHAEIGWERFTDEVIATLNKQKTALVFLLWGSHAQKKGRFIDKQKHLVLTAPHPSPLSAYRGFFGCGHFSKANNYLIKHGVAPIHWQL
ncbi:uracil-DNA glycosylase [Oligella urethralis]|uniref:Uracil-DNA glycosylase n=2 Tax=Oligella urethralis TaxID=90245 RepID=A0A096AMH4_9BURK|nr:uracil-DNA glycosylase [Oligella urethralis]AVL70831.1 uracil-DNA glycosylase [Oligella urethralis]KGF31832.1 uracil-DNA glycosylase [Oligella urethralis DNF00040]MDK6202104.1 uracil-DNA glycosylase [Oligella urethralis]PMC16709.1 uracil-DNA glycosylase [Oligella urethralis]WOS37418.1 Uracil-DNA glycosylase [Oligella urethralis]